MRSTWSIHGSTKSIPCELPHGVVNETTNMKRYITAFVLAVTLAGTASAQLIYTNEGATVQASSLRANVADINHLLTTAGTSTCGTR